ncbi:MAG: hypothetical protein KDN19_22680 [Verrucomicrobiae bacterium]|nr:hypothetical protein [Verrucomicrobiae bacterium]
MPEEAARHHGRRQLSTPTTMKIYWTAPDMPELAPFAPEEQKRIWRECARSHFWSRTIPFAALTAGLGAGLGSIIGDLIASGSGIWGAGIGGGIGGFILGQLSTRHAMAVIRQRYPSIASEEENERISCEGEANQWNR